MFALHLRSVASVKADLRRLLATVVQSGLDVIQQRADAPSELLNWYQNELEVSMPNLQGALLDLPLMKSRWQFYRQLGIRPVEFGELISQAPHLMDFEHTTAGRENLLYLLSIGLSSFLLCNVLIKMPCLLNLSLEAHLKPRMAFYHEELLFSQNEMLKIFEECPEFLQYSIVKDIRFRVEYFKRMGFELEELTKLVMLQCPQILGSTFHEEIQPRLQYLRSVTTSHCVYLSLCDFPHLMLLPLDSQLKPFVDYFQEELNMGRRLFGHMLEKHPQVLAADVDRDIRPKIAFLRELGLDQLQLFKILVHRPQILKKSLKEGLVKKIDEMRSMGVPSEIVTTLLVKSPKYFS